MKRMLIGLALAVFWTTPLYPGVASAEDVKIHGALEPHALDEVQHFADQAFQTQTQLIGDILDQSQTVVNTMKQIEAKITAAQTAWQQHPSPENDAALTEAVTEGAAQGRAAAERMAAIQNKARGIVADLRKGIADQKRKARDFVQTAEGLAQRYTTEFRKVQAAALDARNALDANGQLQNGDIPPSWQTGSNAYASSIKRPAIYQSSMKRPLEQSASSRPSSTRPTVISSKSTILPTSLQQSSLRPGVSCST